MENYRKRKKTVERRLTATNPLTTLLKFSRFQLELAGMKKKEWKRTGSLIRLNQVWSQFKKLMREISNEDVFVCLHGKFEKMSCF